MPSEADGSHYRPEAQSSLLTAHCSGIIAPSLLGLYAEHANCSTDSPYDELNLLRIVAMFVTVDKQYFPHNVQTRS
jgi:hypothetical protein